MGFGMESVGAIAPPVSAQTTGEDEEEDEEMVGKEGKEAPAHHPPAPSSELFNISTTIDPSYIISLIRKLVPNGPTTDHGSHGVGLNNNSDSVHGPEHCMEQRKNFICRHGVSNCRDNEGGAMETLVELDRPAQQKLTDEHGEEVNHQFRDQDNCQNTPNVDYRMDQECGHSHDTSDLHGVSTPGDPREESGCILWDLAANETHAAFMVENLLLEVLLANLNVSKSVRVTEICLGIIGNLACHEVPRNAITSTKGLIQTVLDQLFLDDSLCLSETCRLLTSGLQGSGSVTWAEALLPEHILCRILWIAGNTLNTQLLIKCLELLLAILDNQEIIPVLLPPLMKLDLPNVLLNLLACEMSNLTGGKEPERCFALELILCVIESLSTIDNYSLRISSNKELFQLVYSLVKIPDKIEVASSCVMAIVLIANILTDEPNLASEISQDLSFLQGLLDILPFVSDDTQARSALWSVLDRVLVRVEENSFSQSSLQQYASVLIEKSELIEDDLDDHQSEDSTEDHRCSNGSTKRPNAMMTSLRRIVNILDRWIISRVDATEKHFIGEDGATDDDGRVHRLLKYCHKRIV